MCGDPGRPYAPGATQYWTSYTYDGAGRTLTVTAPDGHSKGPPQLGTLIIIHELGHQMTAPKQPGDSESTAVKVKNVQ